MVNVVLIPMPKKPSRPKCLIAYSWKYFGHDGPRPARCGKSPPGVKSVGWARPYIHAHTYIMCCQINCGLMYGQKPKTQETRIFPPRFKRL